MINEELVDPLFEDSFGVDAFDHNPPEPLSKHERMIRDQLSRINHPQKIVSGSGSKQSEIAPEILQILKELCE